MKINVREVFRFAVHKMVELTQNAMDSGELSPDDVALVIPHQVNERIIEYAIKKSQVPRDRYYININRYGNTSAASIPIALDEARQQGRIHSGDNVVLVAFGGGLTWASAVIRM